MTVEHPKDVYHTVNLVTQCLCIPICSVFVVLRFYTRIHLRQVLGVEDYACLVAWALFMGYCGISVLVGRHGGGYHISDVSPLEQILYRKFCYIATILYCPMALFVKIALLSILTRIFAPYRSKVIFIYIFLGCLCIYYTVALIVKIRICNPIPFYWLGEKLPGGGSCLDQAAALIADSVISVVSDIIILILPLPLTWSLQMTRNKKLRVIGLLGAGGLATAFSLYRLVLVLKEGNTSDQTILFMCVILSGNAEGGVGLICACLPVLNALLAQYRRNYASQKYCTQGSDIQLESQKSRNDYVKTGPRWEPPVPFHDQSHLISYAGIPEPIGTEHLGEGIRKTVAMEQSVHFAHNTSHN